MNLSKNNLSRGIVLAFSMLSLAISCTNGIGLTLNNGISLSNQSIQQTFIKEDKLSIRKSDFLFKEKINKLKGFGVKADLPGSKDQDSNFTLVSTISAKDKLGRDVQADGFSFPTTTEDPKNPDKSIRVAYTANVMDTKDSSYFSTGMAAMVKLNTLTGTQSVQAEVDFKDANFHNSYVDSNGYTYFVGGYAPAGDMTKYQGFIIRIDSSNTYAGGIFFNTTSLPSLPTKSTGRAVNSVVGDGNGNIYCSLAVDGGIIKITPPASGMMDSSHIANFNAEANNVTSLYYFKNQKDEEELMALNHDATSSWISVIDANTLSIKTSIPKAIVDSTSTLNLEQRTDNKTTIQPFYYNTGIGTLGNHKEARYDKHALRPLYLVSDATGSNIVNINNIEGINWDNINRDVISNPGYLDSPTIVEVLPIFKANFSNSTEIEQNRLNSATIIQIPGYTYEGESSQPPGSSQYNKQSDCLAFSTLGHPGDNNKTIHNGVSTSKTTQTKGGYFTDLSYSSYQGNTYNNYAGNMMFDQVKNAIGTSYNSSSFNHFQQVPFYSNIKHASKVFLLAAGKSGFHSLINPDSKLFTVVDSSGATSESLVSCQTYNTTPITLVMNEVGNEKIHLAYAEYMNNFS